MGLLLPAKPASRKVVLHLSPGGGAPAAPVPALLVRVQEHAEGWEAGALFLAGG
jgi:hypothetical protein